jgi:serine/threonine-protein kinase HipA
LPVKNGNYTFKGFPPFFEGLLPEGMMLEALLKACKLDKSDYLGQLLIVGQNLVGAVTIEAIK